MNREFLIKKLKEIASNDDDIERNHIRADEWLLDYIDDDEIKEAWDGIPKWFA